MLKSSKFLQIIFFELQQNSFYKEQPLHFLQNLQSHQYFNFKLAK